MNRYVPIAAAAAFTLTAATALAADGSPKQGFYGALFGGVSILSDNEFSGTQIGPGGPPAAIGGPANVNLDYDAGFSLGAAIGYYIPVSLGPVSPRIEGEFSYQRNEVGNGSNFNGGNQIFSGDQDSLNLFANLLFDWDVLGTGKFKPYVGGGLGVVFLDSEVSYFPVANPAANIVLQEDSSANFAFQAIAGASYQVTKTSNCLSTAAISTRRARTSIEASPHRPALPV